MKVVAVLGGQWGDEGKGKVIDLLSDRFDVVARYHGGHNAGHTVKFGDRHFALHLLPAGVVRGRIGVIGPGVVVDPDALLTEIDDVRREVRVRIDDSDEIPHLHTWRDVHVHRDHAAGDLPRAERDEDACPAHGRIDAVRHAVGQEVEKRNGDGDRDKHWGVGFGFGFVFGFVFVFVIRRISIAP